MISCAVMESFIYTYMIPTYAIGPFHVAFQSPSNVFLVEGGPAVPLYCIASNHSLQHKYMWENSAGQLSPSTPVLWAIKPDTYKCTVREYEGATSPECYSTDIHLEGMILYTGSMSGRWA